MTLVDTAIEAGEFIVVYGADKKIEIVPLMTEKSPNSFYKVFVYRLFKYYFDEESNSFKPAQFHIDKMTCNEIHKDLGNGLNEKSVRENGVFYGKNQTDIPRRSCLALLCQEILSPFYIFQVYSIIVWVLDEYVAYAVIICIFSAFSITISLVETLRTTNKLRQMSFYEIPITVFRIKNGAREREIVNSSELVPGDLIEIPEGVSMPCDAILLNGSCIMNEAMLTGESIPVVKNSLPHNEHLYSMKDDKQYTLYAGTKCIQAKFTQGEAVLGLVTLTGFSTVKGELIRTMLFPKPSDFKFYSDSFKFIGILACIAIGGFLIDLPKFLEAAKGDSSLVRMIIIKASQIVTVTIPPALPTCINIGISVALRRLKKKETFCIAPTKINEAGRINIMCFDKTGTLTEEGLDLLGVRPVFFDLNYNKLSFSKLVGDMEKLKHQNDEKTRQSRLENYIQRESQEISLYSSSKMFPSELLLEVMASCHSLNLVKNSLIGDPLDIKMFESTKWAYEENDNNKYEREAIAIVKEVRLGDSNPLVSILRRFEFSSKLQRMSVVVKKENNFRVHMKGSPEKVRELCDPATVPDNFHSVLQKYTEEGFRVLACASKSIEPNYKNVMAAKREDIETNFNFIGFLIMENKLKDITTEIIENLHSAEVKTIMVTGDNVLTAISVARQCGIIAYEQRIFLGDLSETKVNGGYVIHWKDFEFSDSKLNDDLEPELEYDKMPLMGADPSTSPVRKRTGSKKFNHFNETTKLLMPENASQNVNGESFDYGLVDLDPPFLDSHNHEDYCIAITGRAFSKILHEAETCHNSRYSYILHKLLTKCVVFARMHPDEKALMVGHLMKNQKNIVGMCGDGANDVGALKTANVGVSLSEAEASIAAPFTSKIQDISCIPNLLREGKSALATSYQAFKYMALYSVIQSTSVTILYYHIIEFTNTHYYHIDIGIILPMCATMALSSTYHHLTKYKPTGRLISVQILTSVLGQSVIQAVFQIIIFVQLQKQPWYVQFKDGFGNQRANYENTTIYLVSLYQYLITALAFMVGKPFRESFYKNFYFTLSVVILFALNVLMTFNPFNWQFIYHQGENDPYIIYRSEVPLTKEWQNTIFVLSMINSVATLLWERIVVRTVSVRWKEYRDRKEKLRSVSITARKVYFESNSKTHDQSIMTKTDQTVL